MKKVLVANRGEIACRILRACRELDLQTVAVYSEADREARHVAMADERVSIGPSPVGSSYLNRRAVIEAAVRTGADAIHPGYGLLSEDPVFARECREAGVVFVGPTPESIDLMADKIRARHAATRAGVPVLRASGPIDTADIEGIETAAGRVGYPLMVKPAGGGGGIGMGVVHRESDLRAVVARSQQLSGSVFGNPAIYLERFMPAARHVEVQIFGFGDGKAIHLFERDCTLQRRFQKVVEESPAASIDERLRQELCAAAVAVASSVNYAGAGTVEFVVATDGQFHFLEMNTRIQVEHAVTEMRTGVDLVEWQLLFADGRRDLLPAGQSAVTARGATIECRVYAENPAQGFPPSPGVLRLFRPPAGAAWTRVERGVRQDDTVSVFYDPLLAKVITYGQDREEARTRMLGALERFLVEGVSTNIAMLHELIGSTTFESGSYDTTTLDAFGTTDAAHDDL